jgi:hypothetical protein
MSVEPLCFSDGVNAVFERWNRCICAMGPMRRSGDNDGSEGDDRRGGKAERRGTGKRGSGKANL